MKRIIFIILLLLMGCSNDTLEEMEYSLPERETVIVKLDPFFNEGLYDIEQLKPPKETWLDQMSLEEKVAQLFILDFRNIINKPITEYTQELDEFLSLYKIAGIIYFDENIISKEQVTLLNEKLSKKTDIPLFIGIDEEGGLVSRIGKKNIGVDHLPKARELGKKTLEEVKETAQRLGEQLRAFGFNTDFAPVLDINTNPNNPVIGSRAFSNDAEKVSEYGIIFYQGLKSSGVVTSGKHFPGHGDTANDSHHESVYYTGDETRFNTVESLPFRRASGEGIPMIMVGHITAPALDDSGLPATVSSNLIQRLRKDIKFEGVIITDSFRMKAITNLYSPEQAGVKAIEAGVDIILMPEDFITSYQGILKAVEEGVISEHRINQSLIRIKQIKKQYLDWE